MKEESIWAALGYNDAFEDLSKHDLKFSRLDYASRARIYIYSHRYSADNQSAPTNLPIDNMRGPTKRQAMALREISKKLGWEMAAWRLGVEYL